MFKKNKIVPQPISKSFYDVKGQLINKWLGRWLYYGG